MLDDTRRETVSQAGNGEPGTKEAEALASARTKAVTRSSGAIKLRFLHYDGDVLPATPAEAERERIRIGIGIIIIIIIIRIIIRIRVVPPGVTIATTVVAKTVIGITVIGMTVITTTVIVDICYLV